MHRRPDAGDQDQTAKSDGYYTWTEDDVAAYEAKHAIGSKERLALALGLHTGQRRQDTILMGPQHIRNGLLHVRQSKTGISLDTPVHPELKRNRVPARPVVADFVEIDFQIELDFRNVVGKFGATAHD